MRIKFKLYATLSGYLPPGTKAHAVDIDLEENASPYQIINRFRVPKEMVHLVLLNGVYLNSEEREHTFLKDGDTLAVWPPVAGG